MSLPPPQMPPLVGIIAGSGADIKETNDAFLRLVGYTRAEFASARLNWRSMTPPEYQHLDEAAIKQGLASRNGAFVLPYQKPLLRRDGSRVPVLIVAAFIPGAAGQWMAYAVDLSATTPERVVAIDANVALAGPLPEEFYGRLVGELARDRARLIAMLDNTDALFWAVDRQHHLLAANEAFHLMMRSRSLRDVHVGDSVLGAAYPAEVVELWKGAYGRAFGGERFSMRTQVEVAGQLLHLEAFLSPMVDAQRGVVGAVIVSRDITTRVGIEDALRESEARFRLLAASLPLGIYLTGPAATPIYVNPRLAEMWGSTPEALAGSAGWLDIIHPEDVERVRRESAAGREAGHDYVMELRALLPQLGERHMRVRVAPVEDGGRVTGWVGSVEDDTERQISAAHARQREKMESLGTLAGGIAHDFNNMLSVILGYAELALAEPEGPELEESLREIQSAAGRARDLVRQILAFSRRTEPAAERVDLGSLIVEGVRFLRSTLPVIIELDVRVPEGPLVVRGDAAALQQIVVNLCTNAAHAMSERGGRIAVVLEAEGAPPDGQAILTVSDTGRGMSREVQARIFEPFFTTKQAGEGTGMGLAVVHGVVASHGGTITVESSVGGGTTFHVCLPLVSGAAAKEPEKAAPTQARSARVLVVEDEPALARLTTHVLAREGYKVTTARQGMEALRLFSADPDAFDLVVSDLAMPGLTGEKLAQAIHVVRPGLPFLLVSGFVGALGNRTPRELGVNAVLAKPNTPRDLLEAVRDALSGATHARASRAPEAS